MLTALLQQTSWLFKGYSTIRLIMIAMRNVYYLCTFLIISADHWMVVMSSQLIGFSMGSNSQLVPCAASFHEWVTLFRCSSVRKLWPANLVTCALLNTLHGQRNRGGLSREKFFLYALLASSTWYLLPGYLFKPLSFFPWVCWIAPENIPVN